MSSHLVKGKMRLVPHTDFHISLLSMTRFYLNIFFAFYSICFVDFLFGLYPLN
jgi:hypothetical protein